MSVETLGAVTGTSTGTVVSSSASSNTKGAYAELAASTSQASDGFLLTLGHTGTNSGFRYLVDVATGAAGAETVIASNVFFCGPVHTRPYERVNFPRAIASGVRVAARTQASLGNNTIRAVIHLWQQGATKLAAATTINTYGVTAASTQGTEVDPGGAANTKGAYAEVSASITNAAEMVEVVAVTKGSLVAATYLLDLATGAAGAETVVVANLPFGSSLSTTDFNNLSPVHMPWLPLVIAASTRLAARSQCDITTDPNRRFDVIVHASNGSPSAGTGLSIAVSDTDSAAESVSLIVRATSINVSDTDAPAESVTVRMRIPVSVSDTGAPAEVVSLRMSLVVVDPVTPTEWVSLTSIAPLKPVVFDTRAAAEQVSVSVPPLIDVSDHRAPTDTVTMLLGRANPSVADTVTKAEFVRLLLSRLAINVSDADPPSDHVTMPLTIQPAPPAPPVSADGQAQPYAPTWLIDARQLVGTGLSDLDLLYAGRDVEVLDPPYQARIVDNPVISRQLMDTFWGMTEVSEVSIGLANGDKLLTALYRADPRDQPIIIRRLDLATGELTDEMYAKITSVALGPGTLMLTASSPNLSVFERVVPSVIVTTETFPHAVDIGAIIPVIFGSVTKVPLPYVNRDASINAFDYLAGHGAVTVPAVYFQREDGGFTEIPAAEYQVSTEFYPGLTTIRFPTRRLDVNSRPLVIVADLVGESRNHARNIQSLLSNSTWGLGQTIDTASFDTAAADLDALGLLCDGAMLEGRQAQDVLRELLIVRGMRLGFTSDGKWTIAVDKPRTEITLVLQDGGDGPRTILSAGKRQRPPIGDAISTYKLSYKSDFLNGTWLFGQQRTVTPTFGRERSIDNSFIRDHLTADRVIDYLAKREKFGAETVDFTVPQEGRNLLEGDLVEVTYAPMHLTARLMEVRQANKRLESVSVLVAPWSTEIYTHSSGTLPFDQETFDGDFIIPRPGGLHLVNASTTDPLVWVGCDITIAWNPVSEIFVGLSDEDALFTVNVKDYQVEVWVDGALQRTEYTTVTTYTYTKVKNEIDTPFAGSRTVTFVVRARTFDGELGEASSITVTKPAIDLSSRGINVADGDVVSEYVSVRKKTIDVFDQDTPTEHIQLAMAARRISVVSLSDGNNLSDGTFTGGSGMRDHDFVQVELSGIRLVSVIEDQIDIEDAEAVDIRFGPGLYIMAWEDAAAEADFLEADVTPNLISNVVGIFVTDSPGAFGLGVTESRTILRSPLLINVSDTRTTTESVTVVSA